MYNLVTINEFIQQVWDIECIKIEIKPKDGATDRLVRPYNYDRLPDDATVDDLKARIYKCINEPFIYMMNI